METQCCGHKFNSTLTHPFVSGHLHWMIEMIEGGGQERCFTSLILSFDVNSERFKELPLADEGTYIMKCVTSFKGNWLCLNLEVVCNHRACYALFG